MYRRPATLGDRSPPSPAWRGTCTPSLCANGAITKEFIIEKVFLGKADDEAAEHIMKGLYTADVRTVDVLTQSPKDDLFLCLKEAGMTAGQILALQIYRVRVKARCLHFLHDLHPPHPSSLFSHPPRVLPLCTSIGCLPSSQADEAASGRTGWLNGMLKLEPLATADVLIVLSIVFVGFVGVFVGMSIAALPAELASSAKAATTWRGSSPILKGTLISVIAQGAASAVSLLRGAVGVVMVVGGWVGGFIR